MKKLIKSFFRWMGYEIHQSGYCTDPNTLKLGVDKCFPFIQEFNVHNYDFKFWVVNEDVYKTYNISNLDSDKEVVNLTKLVSRGDRVLEIGTHHGFYTMLLSKLVGPEGYVIGVEASPQNCLVAQAQIALNNLGNCCQVENFALSDKPGKVNLTRMSSNASVVEGNMSNNTIIIKANRGDDLVKEYGPFNVIKVDVEGYEGKVLLGCKEILLTKPKLAIELHLPFLCKYKSNVDEIFEMINVDNYAGRMIYRSDKSKSLPFERKLNCDEVVNLFLWPKN